MNATDPDERTRGRAAVPAHVLNLVLLAVFFGYSLLVYEGLPGRLPVHYDIRGVPDRWEEKAWLAWLTLPLLSLGVTAFFYLLSPLVLWFAPRYPRWVNVPAKKVFLALPPEDQAIVARAVAAILFWFCVPMNALFLYLQWGGVRVAREEWDHLPLWGMGIFLVALTGMLVFFILGTRRLILERAGRNAGTSAGSPG